ncbi:MAG: hypothetical protein E7604_03615 [Ruminococcaceae bacterium]|nr:hypothetical protein [Oscillospiraceae bacterium]
MTRTEFLRRQTLTGANKCRRTPMPPIDVSAEPLSLPERKALGLRQMLETMPVYIGERELIVGTRTYFSALEGNEDGHDFTKFSLRAAPKYINEDDIRRFGCDQSYVNRTHYTPDYGIILKKGIDGIISDAQARLEDASLLPHQREFLASVVIAYQGLKTLILRYADEAERIAGITADETERAEKAEIARVCRAVAGGVPKTFYEAIQLLWLTHVAITVESFEFINYGRLDVLLGDFLSDTPRDEAGQLIDCLLLKMYDQVDLYDGYLGQYAAQLVVTLGGVLENGENAVNDVTMLFLDAIDRTRLPDPEFNLRISSKNPPEFLSRAAELTVSGCNFVSYYNDNLFVESMTRRGLAPEDARSYGFDLCQDINIPGRGDFWLCGHPQLANLLLELLRTSRDYPTFEALLDAYKDLLARVIRDTISAYNEAEAHVALYAEGKYDAYFDGIHNRGCPIDRRGNSPMAPLPLLSALFHGSIETGLDVAFEPYPIKAKGLMFGTVTEAVNGLAAIRRTVYDKKQYTLDEVFAACENNFAGEEGQLIRAVLWSCPKWGNDDDYVDAIAVDVMEFCLRACEKYTTALGGAILGGIHQPHPVPTGAGLAATPDGRYAAAPVAVTLTPESGTMKNGPTAALSSAAKLDPMLVQWNMCVMVNYFASVFRGNDGAKTFETLLRGYFAKGGLQHQPNVMDAEELRRAQLNPENYKDLIVRLWGVSAHFVDLPRRLQDEMIARLEQ